MQGLTANLPATVRTYLSRLNLAHCAAFFQLDSRFSVVATGGLLGHYVTGPVESGDNALELLPILEGLLGEPDPVIVPRAQLDGGTVADMHVFMDDATTWVVLLDASVETMQARNEQQRRLAGRLIDETAKTSHPAEGALEVLGLEVLGQLRVAVFQRETVGGFRLVGPAPTWLTEFDATSFISEGWCWPEQHDLLAGFLADADAAWAPGSTRIERSLIWSESGSEGALHLQAIAMRADGQALLLLRQIDEAVVRNSGNSQRANEWRLQASHMERRLVKERERLLVTLNSIADGVITTDSTGMVDFMNPRAEDLCGWSVDEARGKPCGEVFRLVHESTDDSLPCPTALCLASLTAVSPEPDAELLSRDGTRRSVQDTAAPILSPSGELLGTVLVFHDVSVARELARTVAYQASHDHLTGLINRREFECRLSKAVASAQTTGVLHALCYLDLDNFKVVNDSSGHDAGDALLKQITATLQAQLGDQFCVARLGGDEFCVLLDHCPPDQALPMAQNLVVAIKDLHFTWGENVYEVSASVGLVNFAADCGSASELLGDADAACYAAKAKGRNCVSTHVPAGDAPNETGG